MPGTHVRRPVVGTAMVVLAAALFALNGVVAKVILLGTEISSQRLAAVRSVGALAGFALLAALLNVSSLRVRARELPFLVCFGVLGLALVQWSYFLAIEKLEIGVALVIQFQAPLLVALWARFFVGETVRRRIWIALALALSGLTLVVELWDGLTLDGVGLAAALVAMLSYALYILLAERAVGRRDAISLSAWGFVFAAIFWSALQPWWSFPAGVVGDSAPLRGNLAGTEAPVALLLASMIVLGTIAPFALVVGSLRHLAATRVGIVATLEPVLATLLAFVWLEEALGPIQLVGGAIVLLGIGLAQTAR